jgi:hypothetical protein
LGNLYRLIRIQNRGKSGWPLEAFRGHYRLEWGHTPLVVYNLGHSPFKARLLGYGIQRRLDLLMLLFSGALTTD